MRVCIYIFLPVRPSQDRARACIYACMHIDRYRDIGSVLPAGGVRHSLPHSLLSYMSIYINL